MKNWILATLVVAAPAEALAVGFGTTFSIERDQVSDFGAEPFSATPPATYPSLDLGFGDSVLLQLQPLEFLQGLADERMNLAFKGFYTLVRYKLSGPVSGVAGVGAAFDLFTRDEFKDSSIIVEALGRFGVETGDELRFGLYIVPGLGFGSVSPARGGSDLEMALLGALQLSVLLP